MKTRKLGPFRVSELGLGCMNLSHAYGSPPNKAIATQILNRALDIGYTLIDTAALYGFGSNEELIGEAIGGRRDEFILSSKCGMFKDSDGKRKIDGRPTTLIQTCEDSLRRLKTDVIDLYYLHRWDKNVPIEESIEALSTLVTQGKIRAIGLSEVSADTLRRAHAIHPISAVQTEYSLWSRNAEIKILTECHNLGVAFVAFSPLGRGFLAGKLKAVTTFEDNDIRKAMPRFQSENFAKNIKKLEPLKTLAQENNSTLSQISLAWLLAQGPHIIPIPGTTNIKHLEENIKATHVQFSPETLEQAGRTINPKNICGARYNAATQAEINTEEL